MIPWVLKPLDHTFGGIVVALCVVFSDSSVYPEEIRHISVANTKVISVTFFIMYKVLPVYKQKIETRHACTEKCLNYN